MEYAFVIASCTAMALFVLAIYSWTADRSRRAEQAEKSTKADLLSIQLSDVWDDGFSTARRRNNQKLDDWPARFRLWIEQSGLDVHPLALVLFTISVGLLPACVTWFLLHNIWLTLVAYAFPSTLPIACVAFARHRRCNRLREQLPDALDLMSRMLKAGQTIPQSLRGVADEFEAPIAEEFGYCYEQQNLGLSTDAAMRAMALRTGVLELRILVVAVTVHRHAGGNLSELLNNLASVIRDRYRIQGQIRALTADGRMQAAILLALPLFLLGVLSAVNRDYITILFEVPWLLAGMFIFELIGAVWLHRIVTFDF